MNELFHQVVQLATLVLGVLAVLMGLGVLAEMLGLLGMCDRPLLVVSPKVLQQCLSTLPN